MLFITDVNTWLSVSLTKWDACLEGFQHLIIVVGGNVNLNITNEIENESKLFELINNSLALFQILFNNASLERNGLHDEQRNNHTIFKTFTEDRRCMLTKIY